MQRTLTEIIDLLETHQEQNWAKALRAILSVYQREGSSIAAGMVKGIYGGSGSFSDLVLHDKGNPVRQANDRLETLRRSLFDEALSTGTP